MQDHTKTSKPVIICGMHRSGTSLVADFVSRNGVFMGHNLMSGGRGNPRGHYEDWEFVDLHDRILRDNSARLWFLRLPPVSISSTHVESAQKLISDRLENQQWGWKDPRTTLFLDFWRSLLPEASFILVYRDSQAVVNSLLRRAQFSPGLKGRFQHWAYALLFTTTTLTYSEN